MRRDRLFALSESGKIALQLSRSQLIEIEHLLQSFNTRKQIIAKKSKMRNFTLMG
jgi:DNA-binding PadR family transcriptional regulator